MADDKPKADAAAGELAALRLQLEQERAARKAAEAKAGKAGAADAPKVVPGVKFYRINKPHYRHGELHPAGTVVRVEDEAPSKTWVEVKPQKGAKPLLKELPPEVQEEANLPTPEEAAAAEAAEKAKGKLAKGI